MSRTPLNSAFAVWCWGWDGAGDLDGPDVEPIWELMVSLAILKLLSAPHVRPYSHSSSDPRPAQHFCRSADGPTRPVFHRLVNSRYDRSVRGKGVWTFAALQTLLEGQYLRLSMRADPRDSANKGQSLCGSRHVQSATMPFHSMIHEPCLYYHCSSRLFRRVGFRSLCFSSFPHPRATIYPHSHPLLRFPVVFIRFISRRRMMQCLRSS